MRLFRSRKYREQKIEGFINERKAQSNESKWNQVKKQFRKNKLALYSYRFVIILAFIALLADFLANEKPIACGYQGSTYFPIFREYAVDLGMASWQPELLNVEWKDLDYDWVVWPPVPYLPQNMDWDNSKLTSPFDDQIVKSNFWWHWMGTDGLGRDVLAGMIHGTRIAFLVGIISMGIASFIGILLGGVAGYFGDERLKVSRIGIVFVILFFFFGWFYAFNTRSYILADALDIGMGTFFLELLLSLFILVGSVLIGAIASKPFSRIAFLGKKVNVPIDIMVTRLIEVVVSVPRILLILSVVALITKPSIFLTMTIIGLTSWTGIARFTRAELLKVRNLEYIEAAHSLGFSEFRTLFKHALPNGLSPVFISIAFGIAAAILIEATLSFLGIGLGAQEVTWGSLLQVARKNTDAWWMAVFPGLAIFVTITLYNLIGEGLTDALDPRLRK